MLESLVAPILTQALGNFIKEECFQADTIRIGVWNGRLTLRNIELKTSLLDGLGLPIALRYASKGVDRVVINVIIVADAIGGWIDPQRRHRGWITKAFGIITNQSNIRLIEAEVPWKQLGNRPLVVRVEGIMVLLMSKNEWTEEEEDQRQRAIKEARLLAAADEASGEDRVRMGIPSNGSSYGKWQQYLFTKLLHRLMASIQLQVQDVHIRYEDNLSSPTLPFALGLTLHRTSLTTSDRSQNVSLNNGDQILKIGQVDHLAVYCNPLDERDLACMPMFDLDVDSDIETALSQVLPRVCELDVLTCPYRHGESRRRSRDEEDGFGSTMNPLDYRHHYILHPVHCNTRIWLGAETNGGSTTTGVIAALMEVKDLRITLEDILLRSLVCLSGAIIRFNTIEKLGLKRPKVSKLENPRAWWKYAYEAVRFKIGEKTMKLDWNRMLERRKDRIEYTGLWKARRRKMYERPGRQSSPLPEGLATLSFSMSVDDMDLQDVAKKLVDLEQRLPYEDILIYRRMADVELKQESPQLVATSGSTFSWQRLFGSDEGLALDAETGPENRYAQMVFKLDVELQRGEVSLAAIRNDPMGRNDGDPKPFLRLPLENLHIAANGDCLTGLKKVQVSLEDVQVLSLASEPHDLHPLMHDQMQWSRLVRRRIGAIPYGPPSILKRSLSSRSTSSHSPHIFQSPVPVFALNLEMFPEGSDYDMSIKVEVQETQVALSPSAPWLESILSFLDLPEVASSWAEVELVAFNRLASLRQQLDAKLEYVLRTRSKILLDAFIKGPLLIFTEARQPEDTPTQHLGLCVEFRDLKVMSVDGDAGKEGRDGSVFEPIGPTPNGPPTLDNDPGDSSVFETESVHQLKDSFYDNYLVQISEFRIYLSQDDPSATPVMGAPPSVLALLDPLDFNVNIATSLLSSDTSMARLKVSASCSEVAFRLSDSSLRYLIRLVASSIESTGKAGANLEAVRQKLDRLSQSGSVSHKLSSFVLTPTHSLRTAAELGSPRAFATGESRLTEGSSIHRFFSAPDVGLNDDNRSWASAETSISRRTALKHLEMSESLQVQDDDYTIDGYNSADEFGSNDDFLDAEDGISPPVLSPTTGYRSPSRQSPGRERPHVSAPHAPVRALIEVPKDHAVSVMHFNIPCISLHLSLLHGQRGMKEQKAVAHLAVNNLSVHHTGYRHRHRVRLTVDDISMEGSSIWRDSRGLSDMPSDAILLRVATQVQISTEEEMGTPVIGATTRTTRGKHNRNTSVETVERGLWHPINRGHAISMNVAVGMDPDPQVTGRPFRDLKGFLRVKQVGIHLDQSVLVAILKVFAPLKDFPSKRPQPTISTLPSLLESPNPNAPPPVPALKLYPEVSFTCSMERMRVSLEHVGSSSAAWTLVKSQLVISGDDFGRSGATVTVGESEFLVADTEVSPLAGVHVHPKMIVGRSQLSEEGMIECGVNWEDQTQSLTVHLCIRQGSLLMAARPLMYVVKQILDGPLLRYFLYELPASTQDTDNKSSQAAPQIGISDSQSKGLGIRQLSLEMTLLGVSVHVPIEDEGEGNEGLAIDLREASAHASIAGDLSQGNGGITMSGLVVERELEASTILEMAWIETDTSLTKGHVGEDVPVLRAAVKLCPLTVHISESCLIFLGRLGVHLQVLTIEAQHLLEHEAFKGKETTPSTSVAQAPPPSNPLALGCHASITVESERGDVILSLSHSGAAIVLTSEDLRAGMMLEPDGKISVETALAYASVTHQTRGEEESRPTSTYLMVKSAKRSPRDKAAWEALTAESHGPTLASTDAPHLWFYSSYNGSHLDVKAHVESTEWTVLASGLHTLRKLFEELSWERIDPGGQSATTISPAALAVADVTLNKVLVDLASEEVFKRRLGQRDVTRFVMSFWPPPASLGVEMNLNTNIVSIPDHGGDGRQLGLVLQGAGSLRVNGIFERSRERYLSQCSFTTVVSGQDIQLGLRRVHVHRGTTPSRPNSLNRDQSEIRLLAPFSYSVRNKLDINLEPLRGRNPRLIHSITEAEVQAVDLHAFLNTRAVERILSKAFAPFVSVKDRAAEEARRLERESNKWEAYLINKLPIAGAPGTDLQVGISNYESPSPVVPKEVWEKALLLVTVEFRLTLQSIRVTAINNLCKPSSPLVQGTVSTFKLATVISEGVWDGHLEISTHGQYFNRRLALWEPLLEPWSCHFYLDGGYFPHIAGQGLSSESFTLPRSHSLIGAAPNTMRSTSISGLSRRISRSSEDLTVPEGSPKGNGKAITSEFKQKFLSVSLNSAETLNLNISEVLLESLVSAMTALTKRTRRRHRDRHGDEMSLYWISNDTGVLLYYQAEPFLGTVEQVRNCVEPGVAQVLQVSNRDLATSPRRAAAFQDRAMTAFQDRLVLAVQRKGGLPWPTLLRVSVEEEGVMLYPLRRTEDPSGREEVAWLACEVSQVNGVKMLRVRSTLLFHNASSIPLLLKLQAYDVIQSEHRVEPGANQPLPIHLTQLETSSLLVTPVSPQLSGMQENQQDGSSGYLPALVDVPSLRAEDTAQTDLQEQWGSTLAFSNAHFPDADIYCVVDLERDVNADGKVTGPYGHNRLITFHAPYMLVNLLPHPIDFVLAVAVDVELPPWWRIKRRRSSGTNDPQRPRTPSTTGRLRPGESFTWYAANVEKHDVTLSIRLRSFEWSPPVLISRSTKEGDTKHIQPIEVVDKQGDPLNVSVEVASRAGGRARELALFVPFWVVNTTALPLEFGPDPENWVIREINRKTGEQQILLAGQRLSGARGTKGTALVDMQSTGEETDRYFHRPQAKGLCGLVTASHSRGERLLTHMHNNVVLVGMKGDDDLNSSEALPRIRMRCAGARWSRPYRLSRLPSFLGFFEVRDRVETSWRWPGRGQYKVGALDLSVATHEAGGAFSRTQIVTVSAKYLLVNAFGRGLELRQEGIPPKEAGLYPNTSLPTGEEAPLYWACQGGSRLLRVRIREFGWEWSGKFSPDVEGDCVLRLRNTHTDVKCLMQVRVVLQGSHYVVRFRREAPVFAPYRLENHTLETVWFGQEGLTGPDASEVLLPYYACVYAWDEPMEGHRLNLQWQPDSNSLARAPLAKVSFSLEAQYPSHGHLWLRITKRGPVRVLQILDARLRLYLEPKTKWGDQRLYSRSGSTSLLGQRASGLLPISLLEEFRSMRGTATPRPVNRVRDEEPASAQWVLSFDLMLAGIGVSAISARPEELMYASALDLVVAMENLVGGSTKMKVAVGSIQIDNQMLTASSPIMLVGDTKVRPSQASAVVPASTSSLLSLTTSRSLQPRYPHLEVLLEQDLRYGRIVFIRHLKVGLVPYYLRVDGGLIAAFIKLATSVHNSAVAAEEGRGPNQRRAEETLANTNPVDRLLRDCARAVDAFPAEGPVGVDEDSHKLFFDRLEIDPFRINMSFTASSMLSSILSHVVSQSIYQGWVRRLLDAVGAALSKIENAPLRFSAVEIRHMYSTQAIVSLSKHYIWEAVWQAYILLGTLDVLGNPVAVIANLSEGLKDFLCEPMVGLGKSPLDFIRGLYRGTISLLSRLFYSVLDATQSVASSLHAGILTLAPEGDPKLLLRGEAMNRPPSWYFKGVLQGLKELVMDPVRGAQEGGLQGLREGIVRGVMAASVRPLLSTLEFTLDFCQVFMRWLHPHLSGTASLRRVRRPRLFKSRLAPLTVYSAEQALVDEVLSRVRRGAYWGEVTLWHDIQDTQCVIVTRARILMVRILTAAAGSSYLLEWQVPLKLLLLVEAEDTMVELHYLYGTYNVTPKLGPMPSWLERWRRGGRQPQNYSNSRFLNQWVGPIHHTGLSFGHQKVDLHKPKTAKALTDLLRIYTAPMKMKATSPRRAVTNGGGGGGETKKRRENTLMLSIPSPINTNGALLSPLPLDHS